ncbi:OprD family porin [Ferrimonas lipolytica]|uniref:OprD family porin n=2 Tax=Ferrimonas lipolytica TaxID=2724191 RepID=A0A6H1UJU7_9GAMM|nr:OprD family porin [Ferrimonas lipolytica]
MLNSTFKLSPILLAVAAQLAMSANATAIEGITAADKLALKSRTVYFDRDYEKRSSNDSTLAQGLELNYQSGEISDFFTVGASFYGVANIKSSGSAGGNILPSGSHAGDVRGGFGKVGQAYIGLSLVEDSNITLGYQKTKTMLLASSGSRAIPSTFRGITGNYQWQSFKVYGYVFDEWSRRGDDEWESFETVNGDDIDYVWGFGTTFKQGKWQADAEYLNSDNYLAKYGIRGSYSDKLAGGKIKLSAGIFFSEDDGSAFKAGSDKNLDNIDSNDGQVYYLDANWNYQMLTFGVAFAQVDEIWIEDNFAGDHGTNPLPTRAPIGPDLTNAEETIWQGRVGFDFAGIVDGLTINMTYTEGKDAENAKLGAAGGTADEDYWAIDTRYNVAAVKGLKLRWLYADYNSDETGSVGGVKDDEKDHRVYVDYSYKF